MHFYSTASDEDRHLLGGQLSEESESNIDMRSDDPEDCGSSKPDSAPAPNQQTSNIAAAREDSPGTESFSPAEDHSGEDANGCFAQLAPDSLSDQPVAFVHSSLNR